MGKASNSLRKFFDCIDYLWNLIAEQIAVQKLHKGFALNKLKFSNTIFCTQAFIKFDVGILGFPGRFLINPK